MPLICLYSHDGEGLGHFRRNLNIATAATRKFRGVSAQLLTGSMFPGLFELPTRCDYLKVPTLVKGAAADYESPLGAQYTADCIRSRSRLLKSAMEVFTPSLLVVDKHPGGLNNELLPALQWLKKHSPETRVVLGLRDVLDEGCRVREEWQRDDVGTALRKYYDRIWVYGDRQVHDTIADLDFEPAVGRLAINCGYVVTTSAPVQEPTGPLNVVAMVGGGHDGFPVLSATLNAVRDLRENVPTLKLRLLAGPLMPPDEYRTLRQAVTGSSWVTLERFSSRMMRHLINAAAVVTMGGYNSVMECIALRKPAIVVPRELPRKEQLIRAEAFAKLGLVKVVRYDKVGSGEMQKHLNEILCEGWKPLSTHALNLDGYSRILKDIQETFSAGAKA